MCCFWLFTFAWVCYGMQKIFKNHSVCKKGKIYLESYNLWAIMMSVLVFWAFVILFGLIWLIIFTLKKLGVDKNIFRFRKPNWRICLILGSAFLVLFFINVRFKQIGVGISYLNEAEDGCWFMR